MGFIDLRQLCPQLLGGRLPSIEAVGKISQRIVDVIAEENPILVGNVVIEPYRASVLAKDIGERGGIVNHVGLRWIDCIREPGIHALRRAWNGVASSRNGCELSQYGLQRRYKLGAGKRAERVVQGVDQRNVGAIAFVIGEEEQLIFDDGTAEISAKLVEP